MSITKAAIGILYHIHEDEFPRDETLEFTTIGEALNMRAGKRYADDKEFDYFGFRDMVETNQNLRTYSVAELKKQKDTDDMDYSDLTYQLLVSNMDNVAKRFGVFMEDAVADDMKREEEFYDKKTHITYYKYGKGWKWEHTRDGEPLGPHGLYMTQDTAMEFGRLAKHHVLDMSSEQKTPCQNWFGIGMDEFTHYWNGWFLTAENAYAVGYVVQVIALTKSSVQTQLYEEDWDWNGDFMDNEKNKRKHPRWFFIKNIEKKYPNLQF